MMVAVRGLRLALVLMLATGACAVGFLSTTSSEASSGQRAWTHRLTSLSGEYVDHWSVNDPRPCGPVGDGTVTVKFRMAVRPRLAFFYDRFSSAEPSGFGNWVLGTPSAHGQGVVPWPSRPVTGTITLVDNTAPRAPEPDEQCEQPNKTGCGTTVLSGAKISIGGYNRNFLIVDLRSVEFGKRGGTGRSLACRIGQTTSFTERPYSGGTRLGELLLRMPTPSAFARRRVLTVTGTSRKRTSFAECETEGENCTDDVTRRFTATFRRI